VHAHTNIQADEDGTVWITGTMDLGIDIDEDDLYDSDDSDSDAVYDSDDADSDSDDDDDDDTNELNIKRRAALGDRDLLDELLSKGQKRKAHTSSKQERNDPVSYTASLYIVILYILVLLCSSVVLLHLASDSSVLFVMQQSWSALHMLLHHVISCD
jgi:hypothetical protein